MYSTIKQSLGLALAPYRAALKNTLNNLTRYQAWFLAAAGAVLAIQMSTSSILELPTTMAKLVGLLVCLASFGYFYAHLKRAGAQRTRAKTMGRAVLMAAGVGIAAHPMYFSLCAALPFITNAIFSQDYLYAAGVVLIGIAISSATLLLTEFFIRGARLDA